MKPRNPGSAIMRIWTLTALLVGTAFAAAAMRPESRAHGTGELLDLYALIPGQFAGWQALPKANPLIVDPRVSAQVEATYAETMERVYRHADGKMIMLSVAYGDRQLDDSLQAHRPEYCYRAQGFTIENSHNTAVKTVKGALPVRRMLTRRGHRVEPVTYWLTVGQRAVLPGLGRQLAQLSYGLRGEIPDGLLVRISSLNATPGLAWPVHERFIADLFQALPSGDLKRIAGDGSKADLAQRF